MPEDPNPHPDPDKAVDRALRIGQLRAELAELTGKPVAEHTADNPPDDDPEAFFRHMENLESGPTFPLADLLKDERNFAPAPPDRLTDPIDLHENLWLLLYALASMRVFLYGTDHLSDEALYRLLVDHVLRSETVDMPVSAGWNCRFDLTEFADAGKPFPETYLRYYADETMRQQWAQDFPDDPIPPHEDPPYDRDAYLPTFT